MSTYNQILSEALNLAPDEQLRLLEELAQSLGRQVKLEHQDPNTELSFTSVESIILSERDWEKFVSALENPPEPNEALKAAIREHQQKYGKW